jgi:uncharacterized protein
VLQALAAASLAFALSGAAGAQALQPIPAPEARVIDLTGTLTAEQQAALEQKLAAFSARKGAQVGVLLVPTTEPEAIEQYAIRVYDQWKLGRAEVDDGALLLVAKNDRALRIEVGYGLEGALPDAIANRIIDETVVPLFKQGDFYGGIEAGLDRMIAVIDGEPLPPPDRTWTGTRPILDALPFLLVVLFVGSAILRAIFGRTLGSFFAGGAAGALAWVFTHIFFFAATAALLGFLFTLMGGLGRGGRWASRGRGGFGGWGPGGFGGGWGGGSGGGFGGWGGGMSGGGGASGRW